jgi:putative FmdB family regulatory protein
MPLYEYECETCGERFERIQKFSDPLVKTCPTCDGPVRKLLSSPAIQFKGSGWYITDYKKSGGDTKGSGAEKKGDSSSDKSDAPADKPAEKPASSSSESSSSKAD